MSLYQVLQLGKEIDISEFANYPQHFGIKERIEELVENIRLDHNITIITPEAKSLLQDLAYSELNSINFPAYTNLVGFGLILIFEREYEFK